MASLPQAISSRRLWAIRRLIELPLLLKQRTWSQAALANLFEVDGVTIRRDVQALSSYWPIETIRKGRYVFYRLARDAEPTLPRAGQRTRKKP
jgi:predicted DNA-binding transcriptional regulator YafY